MIFKNTVFIVKIIVLGFIFCSLFKGQVFAVSSDLNINNEINLNRNPVITIESLNPTSVNLATESAVVSKVLNSSPDITENGPEIKGKLEKYLDSKPLEDLTPFNFLQHGIVRAVAQGVPANTLVLVLLFPLIATVVVISRHIIGLKSFGIFSPALLAIVFLSTGLFGGILLFSLILTVATVVRLILRKTRVQYLPRMAIFMWMISMVIFITLLIAPSLGQMKLSNVGIFPILILMLSVESFLDIQITRSFSQAMSLTLETLIVAVSCYYLMSIDIVQKFALLNPEIFSVMILVVIAFVNSYSGVRLMELWRFRKIIEWE